MGIGEAQQTQLLLTIVIVIITVVPFHNLERYDPAWYMSYSTVGFRVGMEFVWGICKIVFAVSWIIYAIRSDDFTNSHWQPDGLGDNSTVSHAGYFYLVINAWIIVFLVLVKGLVWGVHMAGQIDAFDTTLTLRGLRICFLSIWVLSICVAASAVLLYTSLAYDTRNASWDFLIVAWSFIALFAVLYAICFIWKIVTFNSDTDVKYRKLMDKMRIDEARRMKDREAKDKLISEKTGA